ncbi:type IV pilus modification protein PilV [Marinobacter sp. MBR-105]
METAKTTTTLISSVDQEAERQQMNGFNTMVNGAKAQRGMTLIEILVTVLVLAVGLLGMASLTVGSLKNNQGAFLRTQGTVLAYDMADRMRANVAEALNDSYNGTYDKSSSITDPACEASGCKGSERVNADLFAWKKQMEGADGKMALLPDWKLTIAGGGGPKTAGNVYTITVTWKEDQWSEAKGSMSTEDQQTVIEFTL